MEPHTCGAQTRGACFGDSPLTLGHHQVVCILRSPVRCHPVAKVLADTKEATLALQPTHPQVGQELVCRQRMACTRPEKSVLVARVRTRRELQ
jgi:hypothetical protein